MLQGVRDHILSLVGQRTSFPPPAFGSDTPAPLEVRKQLETWHADAAERYRRIFLAGQPLLAARSERALFDRLTACRLMERVGPSIYRPCVRLFPVYGNFIATDALTHRDPDQVFSLMFEQVYLIRNMGLRDGDDVLELCLGSGVNSIFAASRAGSVTGVDINPRALAFARFNRALNDAGDALELAEGSLFEPLGDSLYDLILVNPPFELVPQEETWFLHSDGGEDGLDVIRSILEEAPAHLRPGGRFEVITWSPGSERGPLLVDLMRRAFPRHRQHVHILDVGPIEAHLGPFKKCAGYEAYRERLAERGLGEVYFLFVRSEPAATPGVEITHPEAEVAACDAISDDWA